MATFRRLAGTLAWRTRRQSYADGHGAPPAGGVPFGRAWWRELGGLLHTDATQAAGRMPIADARFFRSRMVACVRALRCWGAPVRTGVNQRCVPGCRRSRARSLRRFLAERPSSRTDRRRPRAATLMRDVRCGRRQLRIAALLPKGFYEQPRVAMTNSVCSCGRDSTRQPGPATDRYGNLHTSRFVRPLAGCATLISIEQFVLVTLNVRGGAAAASVVGFRRWPRRTAGRGLGSLSRFGDGVESVCCGGPQSSVGCGVRGRPSVIASPGSLQRHPARTGMHRNKAPVFLGP